MLTQLATYEILGMQTFFYQREVLIRKVFVAQAVSLRPRTHTLTDSTTTGNVRYVSVKMALSNGNTISHRL